jgi:hypothetical protein
MLDLLSKVARRHSTFHFGGTVRNFSLAEYAEGADLEIKPVGHGSSSTAVTEPDSKDENLGSSESLKKSKSTAVPRKSTGPRTQRGKDRSKNNALKFGILSKAAVLPGESQAEFGALLNGLRDHFQPIGALEVILVEKLALDLWRYRRFLIAEGAEIQAGAEFVEWNQREQYREEATRFPQLQCNGGLIKRISNPEALAGCLNLLEQLRDRIKEIGFNPEWDDQILTKLYGEYDQEGRQEDWRHGVRSSYREFSAAAAFPDGVRRDGGFESVEAYKDSFIVTLNDEIKRLERYKNEQATVLSIKLKLESLRRSIPDGLGLDRLLRYAAAVSRDIERTLNQLERLQRMRLGQEVPPSINLSVTTSKD